MTVAALCLVALAGGWLGRSAWDAVGVAQPPGSYADLEEIAQVEAPFERARALTLYLAEVTENNLMKMVAEFEAHHSAFGAFERNFILARWAEIDADSMFTRLKTWSDTELQKVAALAGIEALVARDRHQAAVRYWESLPERYLHVGAVVLTLGEIAGCW